MTNFFLSPFLDNEFLRHALFAGILVSLICAVAGTFVVLRGLAFVGDALAHGVLPGIATALILGVSGVFGAMVGAAVMMGGVNLVTRKLRLSGDTSVGLLFVGMLALGVMITSRSKSFSGDLTRILFGELLGVSWSQLAWQTVAFILVGTTAWVCRRPFLLLCVDEGLTESSGFSVRKYHVIMLTLVAITIVASFQTVGTLLVLGMLIAPPATGALLSRRLSTMIIIAAVSGSIATYAGLLISYHADLAAGASIVLSAVALFAFTATVREFRLSLRRTNRADDELPHQHTHIRP
jgi:ABC-type Mn2+/Zn2+ transport system permease subunit